MHVLADFLNHGVLPFVGRDDERARIVEFWRSTLSATELRAMMVVGEAGIGKSRLLDDALPRIVDAGGSIVHVKLYSEATLSFLTLVARALWHPDAARSLLASEPEPTLAATGSALQRLARLRPTLFVIEDLHLLTADALGDFTRLLRQLADETLSMIAIARPVELVARGVIEPYLVEEVVLAGLDDAACASIWEQVCGASAGADVIDALHESTSGNPLAMRSALRGALKALDGATSVARVRNATAASLAGSIKRTVGLLAEGMTADLDATELEAARKLATLGEVFARASAMIMLDNHSAQINSLIFKGVIATAVAPPAAFPIEPSDTPPLVFTHTLLHRELARGAKLDDVRMVRVMEAAPLYSLLPYTLLSERALSLPTLNTATVYAAFDRTIKVQIAIRQSALWRRTDQTFATAVRLLESKLGEWSQAEWERMIVKLAHYKFHHVRRESREAAAEWLARLIELTASTTTDELALGRLYALADRVLTEGRGNRAVARQLWDESQLVVASRPALRFTFPYTEFLVSACVSASANDDIPMLRLLEADVDEFRANPELEHRVRIAVEHRVRPQFLAVVESATDVDIRLSQIAEYDSIVPKSDLGLWKQCLNFEFDVALADSFFTTAQEVLRHARMQGLVQTSADILAKQLALHNGRISDRENLIASYDRDLATITNDVASVSEYARPLVDSAVLRGQYADARKIIAHYSVDLGPSDDHTRVLLAIGGDDGTVGEALFDQSSLEAPIVRLSDILTTHVALLGLDRISRARNPAADESQLEAAVRERVKESLEWLVMPGRELLSFARALLELGRSVLVSRSHTAWESRLDLMESQRDPAQLSDVDSASWRLTMFGKIRARRGDQEARLQGARARALVAAMVAVELRSVKLDSSEFALLVVGDELSDVDNARNILKTTIHRLREVLGRDAIDTHESIPRFNPAIVKVDLLDANDFVSQAIASLRASSPMQARSSLMNALEISNGEVAFPAIYDTFIESVREDFESKLRGCIIAVCDGLIREGGYADAVDVLRLAVTSMPGDDDLRELLQTTLSHSGDRTGAERERRRTAFET